MADDTVVDWYCSTMIPNTEAKGVADKKALWTRGQTLKVGFLGGSAKLQDRVLATAKRWTKEGEGGANLMFAKVAEVTTADIRVAFDAEEGSWSYIGRGAEKVDKDKPTMNLGWVAENSSEKSFASVVLHEFGHAIALLHEHNHPDAVINWNKDVVYADLKGKPNFWSKETIDYNVFESYPPGRVVKSLRPDMVSIMIYTIPGRWLLGGQKGIMPSDTLSKGDIEFIRELYR